MVEQIRARILWRLFPFREQKTFEQSSFPSAGTLLVKRTRLFVCLFVTKNTCTQVCKCSAKALWPSGGASVRFYLTTGERDFWNTVGY